MSVREAIAVWSGYMAVSRQAPKHNINYLFSIAALYCCTLLLYCISVLYLRAHQLFDYTGTEKLAGEKMG